MIGFLKKLMGKSEPEPTPAAPAPVAPPAPPPSAPVSRAAAPAAPAASKVVIPPTASRPAAIPGAPAAPAAAPIAVPTFSGPTIDLPLRALWPKLNTAVTQVAARQPDGAAQLKLPLEYVQPMLAKGAIKIPYAIFRSFTPDGVFPALPGKEALEVDLPLADVLARVKPDQLPRRAQKKIELPDDIGPIFGTSGTGLKVAEAKAKAVPAPDSPAETPPPAAQAPAAAEPPKAAPVVPPTRVPEPVPAPLPPSPSISPIAATPPPSVSIPERPPLNTEPIRAPKLDPSLASLKPKPTATAPAVPQAGPPKPGVFALPLAEVAPAWAAAGKIEYSALTDFSLEIPTSTLEASLKTGKLAFSWRQFRDWLTPKANLPSLADDQVIELPLALVAPKFISQRTAAAPKKRVQVSDDIPDLFAQKARSAPPTVPAAAAPPAAPAAAPVATPAPSAPKPALEFGEIFGQPDKKNWSFAEVTQKTAALRGVAGALIATSDGLLIAGTWPPGVQPDSVAAFIPQMYSRMVQCTKELKLGEPGNFTLLIENVPLQVFKTAGNYFVALGRAGENLPKAQLTALAMRLALTQPAN